MIVNTIEPIAEKQNLYNFVMSNPTTKQIEIVHSHETTKNAIPRIAYLQMTEMPPLSLGIGGT